MWYVLVTQIITFFIIIWFLGKSQIRRTGPTLEHQGEEFSEADQNNFEFRSEIIDICSNVADFTVFRNDQYVPMLNYLIALEGNVQMTSAWCHIANSIPEYYIRPRFTVKGEKMCFPKDGPKAGAAKTTFIGSIKKGAVLRPDCRLGVAKIIQVIHFGVKLSGERVLVIRIWFIIFKGQIKLH